MSGPQRREERPGGGARLITKGSYAPKHTTESALAKLVLSFAAVTAPGARAAGFLPDGSVYLLERTDAGVFSEAGDEDSAARFLAGPGGS